MRRIGAHLSIAGGLFNAVNSIVAKGGNCLQIFSSSPRIWLSSLPDKPAVEQFKTLAVKHDIQPIFIHAKYLINLASDREELLTKSIDSLKYDLKVADLIGAAGVIVHLGSHLGRGFEAIKSRLTSSIKLILQASQGKAMLIIENSAGQQGKLCSQLSEIKSILGSVNSHKLAWCLDTCHAYNAGYSLGEASENTLIQSDIVNEAKKLAILDRLVCLHVNDSRDEFASGHDRHANLGEGKMGLKVLAEYVNHPLLKQLPLIIETPGFDNQGPDKKNLDILKSLVR
ncbi:MAG: deoxyribonuclease IV [Patescibacteria group bacterium]|nr:deoxyribonuclease IV [Patescibacteria group bacterium]